MLFLNSRETLKLFLKFRVLSKLCGNLSEKPTDYVSGTGAGKFESSAGDQEWETPSAGYKANEDGKTGEFSLGFGRFGLWLWVNVLIMNLGWSDLCARFNFFLFKWKHKMMMGHAYIAGTIISTMGWNVKRGKESPDAVNDLLTS